MPSCAGWVGAALVLLGSGVADAASPSGASDGSTRRRSPRLEAWPPRVESRDGKYSFRPTGRLHLDGRFDPSGLASSPSFDTGYVIRRARIGFRAKAFDRLEADVAVQYSQGDLSFENAYLEVAMTDWLHLRAGQMLLPFSLQRRTSSNALVHPERAVMVEKLVFFRAFGAALDVSLLDESLELQFGVYDAATGVPGFDQPPDLAGRIRGDPVAAVTMEVAYRWSPPTSRGGVPADARTSGGELAPILIYRDDDAWREGSRHDAAAGARFVLGPVMLQAELLVEHTRGLHVQGENVGNLLDWGGFVDLSWAITGERQDGEELEPRRSLGPRGAGAWQIALRYETLVADRKTLEADLAFGRQTLHGGAATVIWTPLPGVRWMLYYSYSRLGGASAGPVVSRDVHAVITRIDFHF